MTSTAPDEYRTGNQTDQTFSAGTFGMALIIAALGMLFLGAVLSYIGIRIQWINPDRQPDPPLGTLSLPAILWVSTLVILLSSVTLQWALLAIRAGRRRSFGRAMVMTMGLAVGFLIIQVPGLWQLAARQQDLAEGNTRLYVLMMLLIIVHAAHVIGGMIPMGLAVRNALLGRYSPQRYAPVKHLVMYWHFIDVVWLVMFNVFLLLG
jgi:heme/copper-type cytochrome/quinol oxidase subunit 3